MALLTGTVDEVAVYGTALSAGDVLTHYSAGAYGTSTAPFITTAALARHKLRRPRGLVFRGGRWLAPAELINGGRIIRTSPGANGSMLVDLAAELWQCGQLFRPRPANSVSNIVSISGPARGVVAPDETRTSIPDLVLAFDVLETNLTDVTGRGNDGTGLFWSGTTT